MRRKGMVTRRGVLSLVAASGLVSCARGSGGPGGEQVGVDLAKAQVARASADDGAVAAAVPAVTGFSADLYRRLAAEYPGNLICSPYSAAVALGMTVQGARGATAEQMLKVLHAGDGPEAAASLGAGLGGLDLLLEGRTGRRTGPDGEPVMVRLAPVNSVWVQQGLSLQQAFLNALARDFDAGMHQVDYVHATERARSAINDWVSGRTAHRIPHLFPPETLTSTTRLVLVNALYLKAPWQQPFLRDRTAERPFARLDGSTVAVPLMTGRVDGAAYVEGPGWVAVDLPYAGGELALAVIVPDRGRFPAVEASLDGPWLSRVLTGFRRTPVQVDLPRWTTRTAASLVPALTALGMPLPFTAAADFTGITSADRLGIGEVRHQGYLRVDEAGTEAAAATAVEMRALGMLADPPTVRADRPFLCVLHDVASATPLFLGRVTDPSS